MAVHGRLLLTTGSRKAGTEVLLYIHNLRVQVAQIGSYILYN